MNFFNQMNHFLLNFTITIPKLLNPKKGRENCGHHKRLIITGGHKPKDLITGG